MCACAFLRERDSENMPVCGTQRARVCERWGVCERSGCVYVWGEAGQKAENPKSYFH